LFCIIMGDYEVFQGKFGWGIFGKGVRLGLDTVYPAEPGTRHFHASAEVQCVCDNQKPSRDRRTLAESLSAVYAMGRIQFRRDELPNPAGGAAAEVQCVVTTTGAEVIVTGQCASAERAVEISQAGSNLVRQQGWVRSRVRLVGHGGRFRLWSDLVWRQRSVGLRDNVGRQRRGLWFRGKRTAGIEQHQGADE
jgi:hypothetical protein